MFHRDESKKPETANEEEGQAKDASSTQDRSYAAPYAGSSYGATQQSSAPSQHSTINDEGDEQQLVIGKGINFAGQIESCERLIVHGTVEAALKGARALEVAQSGTFYGSIEIKEATIAGRFEGDLAVDGLLRVLSTGAITGSISYKSLEVESGALIEGKISPITAASQPKASNKAPKQETASEPAKRAPAPKTPKVSTKSKAANAAPQSQQPEGNQLFAANVAGGGQ